MASLASALLLLAGLVHCQGQQGKHVIQLLSLLPYNNPDPSLNPSWDGGQNIRPALELAKDQINNSTLLGDYVLNLTYAEGGCNIRPITTVSLVMEAFVARERLTGVIGPGCSVSTAEVSSLTNRSAFSLVMVHGAGSPVFADRTKYPYLLGTLGSNYGFVHGLLFLLERAGWRRIAVMYDDSRDFYLHAKRNLQMEIRLLNKTEVEFLSPVSPTFIPLPAFEESHLRVVFVMCPAALSQKIICLAYNNGLVYKSYQWAFVGHRLESLLEPVNFVYERTQYSCSRSDMATALEMSILLTYSLTPADDSMLVANTTYEDYLHYYTAYRDMYNREAARSRNSTFSVWATFYYDSVWAWALVLDNLTKTQDSFEVGTHYGNLQQSQMIVEQFYGTSFKGMSGDITFDRETGYTNRAVDIAQIRDTTAYIITNGTTIFFISDSFPSTVRESSVIGALATCSFIIQILVIMILHVLTIAYRQRPSIKASSPKLLHISYAGAYITAFGTLLYFLFIAARFPVRLRHYFCQLLWGWCLPIGFILSIAPVAMRTWRVYRIFKHYLNPGPLISNPILIGSVIALLLPVLTASIVWTAIDPFRVQKFFEAHTSSIMVVRVKEECNCSYYFAWLGLILAYLTAILVLMSILSLLTRNITNRSFATTALRVLAYILTIAFLLGFPLFYLLSFFSFDPNYSFSTFIVHINFMMAVFTACVFIPPVLPICQKYRQKVRKISIASNSSGATFMSYLK